MSRLRSVSASESVVAGGEHVVIRGSVPNGGAIETLAGRGRTGASANHAVKGRRYAPTGDEPRSN